MRHATSERNRAARLPRALQLGVRAGAALATAGLLASALPVVVGHASPLPVRLAAGPLPPEQPPAAGSAEAAALFAGIPQRVNELGDPAAPLTLTEFADLQCPFCRDVAVDALPAVIEQYVRPGKVRLVFDDYPFLGPDSVKAARMASAVGLQGQELQFVELFFRNQGPEGSGYVTDGFLLHLAGSLPGVDAAKALGAARGSPEVDRELRRAADAARRFAIDGTPAFLLGKTGEVPRRIEVRDASGLARAIDALLPRK